MPADSEVLGVENKINFLAPAKGERFVAIGKVIKAGRTLAVCSGEVWAVNNGEKNARCGHADDDDDREEAGIGPLASLSGQIVLVK